MKKNYRVWTCKLVVDADQPMPMGFDSIPRNAAVGAVERAGFPVLSMFSGWGASLTDLERQIVEETPGTDGVHIAGRWRR
jgi:hypothetical protein